MKRKVIKQHDVPDMSNVTHVMTVCDSYEAWRALALMLGYRIYTLQEESTDDVVYRECKDEFGRIAGTHVMFRDPGKQNAGHICVPAALALPTAHRPDGLTLAHLEAETGKSLLPRSNSDHHLIDKMETRRGNALRLIRDCTALITDALQAHANGHYNGVSDHMGRVQTRLLNATQILRRNVK